MWLCRSPLLSNIMNIINDARKWKIRCIHQDGNDWLRFGAAYKLYTVLVGLHFCFSNNFICLRTYYLDYYYYYLCENCMYLQNAYKSVTRNWF